MPLNQRLTGFKLHLVYLIMPQAGFEPVHCFQYSDLNAARLPVPPLGQLN